MQTRLDPNVDLEVEARRESDLGHVHPVGADQLADGLLLGHVHGEAGGEVEGVDQELHIDLREDRHGHIGRLHGAHTIDLIVLESQSLERTLGVLLV